MAVPSVSTRPLSVARAAVVVASVVAVEVVVVTAAAAAVVDTPVVADTVEDVKVAMAVAREDMVVARAAMAAAVADTPAVAATRVRTSKAAAVAVGKSRVDCDSFSPICALTYVNEDGKRLLWMLAANGQLCGGL